MHGCTITTTFGQKRTHLEKFYHPVPRRLLSCGSWSGLWFALSLAPSPLNICAPSCDPSYADGTPKPASQLRSSYSYAQQIRAALAHAYANSFNRGSEKWAKIYSSEQNTQAEKVLNSERYKGNPTTSVILRKYMIALRKRKVRR